MTVIHFVLSPEGRIVEGSQSSVSEDVTLANVLRHWFPPSRFPGADFGHRYHGVIHDLWPAMERAGYKLLSVEVEAEGVTR